MGNTSPSNPWASLIIITEEKQAALSFLPDVGLLGFPPTPCLEAACLSVAEHLAEALLVCTVASASHLDS